MWLYYLMYSLYAYLNQLVWNVIKRILNCQFIPSDFLPLANFCGAYDFSFPYFFISQPWKFVLWSVTWKVKSINYFESGSHPEKNASFDVDNLTQADCSVTYNLLDVWLIFLLCFLCIYVGIIYKRTSITRSYWPIFHSWICSTKH